MPFLEIEKPVIANRLLKERRDTVVVGPVPHLDYNLQKVNCQTVLNIIYK